MVAIMSSSRTIIYVEGIDFACIYMHDNESKKTLDWLRKFNREFTKNRGDDPEYKFAQLLRYSTEVYPLDNYLTWGLVPYNQPGVYYANYVYSLLSTGKIKFEKIVNVGSPHKIFIEHKETIKEINPRVQLIQQNIEM